MAKRLFRALLNEEPFLDEAYYAAFSVGRQDIGLDPHGRGMGRRVR